MKPAASVFTVHAHWSVFLGVLSIPASDAEERALGRVVLRVELSSGTHENICELLPSGENSSDARLALSLPFILLYGGCAWLRLPSLGSLPYATSSSSRFLSLGSNRAQFLPPD